MRPPDAAPPPRRKGASDQIDRVKVRDHTSPTVTYVTGRERILGRRVAIPLHDAEAAAEVIAEALGGRELAGAYVEQMLAELNRAGVAIDGPCDHPRCAVCRDVEAVSA